MKWIEENNPYFSKTPNQPVIIYTWLSCNAGPNVPEYIKKLCSMEVYK